MRNTNIDAIKKIHRAHHPSKPAAAAKPSGGMDAIVRQRRLPGRVRAPAVVVSSHAPRPVSPAGIYGRQKVPLLVAVFGLLLAFGGGMWFSLNTYRSQAQSPSQGQVLGAFTDTPAGSVVLPGVQVPAQADPSVSNDILFNTPIEYLKNYIAAVSEPDVIARRAKLLKDYLTEKKSPFAEDAETIASQPHWQLILAIAFAESTLGRNCADNNCSNIGVKPGAPSWRRYANYKDWVVDFNRLLDKRYKDQTLDDMCGVYVKPCNPNWLLATQQILGELKDQGIE